jgi:hypothetical protein
MTGQDEQPGRLSEDAEDLEPEAEQSKDVKGGAVDPKLMERQLDEISLVELKAPPKLA